MPARSGGSFYLLNPNWKEYATFACWIFAKGILPLRLAEP